MLDEGLDVLLGLWTGEPFSYGGEHYEVDEVTFLPKPLQEPRIPIWVAGMWPGGRPFRRAARFDGVVPIGFDGENFTDIGPEEVAAILGVITEHRVDHGPYDFALAVDWIQDRPAARERIAALEVAGVTWVREQWNPWSGYEFEDWQKAVLEGPPE